MATQKKQMSSRFSPEKKNCQFIEIKTTDKKRWVVILLMYAAFDFERNKTSFRTNRPELKNQKDVLDELKAAWYNMLLFASAQTQRDLHSFIQSPDLDHLKKAAISMRQDLGRGDFRDTIDVTRSALFPANDVSIMSLRGYRIMKFPETNSQWLSDVREAYKTARSRFDKGLTEIDEIEDLYKLSARLAADNRGIINPEILDKMYSFSIEPVEYEFSIGPTSRASYKFQFVIAYLQSHVPAGIFTEMEGDRIMEYLNERWNLFSEV